MKVPQFIPWIGKEEYKAIEDCFTRQWITEGLKAKEFQASLLDYIGVSFGHFAPNGTLALYLALKSLGIGPGDEVLVSDFTFIASANAIEMVGAQPVFVDVCAGNYQIDCAIADRLISAQTKAIMPCHIFGTIGDMDRVGEFAKKHDLYIIEDAAQAIGVRFKGRHAGTFGDVGVFSFFADKLLTTAEGGFIGTNNEQLSEKLQLLRNQGRLERGTFIHPEIGYNFRITDLQCAIGIAQLKKINQIINRKLAIKKHYEQGLAGIDEVAFIQPIEGADWVPFRVGILCQNAHELMSFLQKRDIEPRSFFYPLHKQPCYDYLKKDKRWDDLYEDKNFSNSLFAYEHGICLPTFPTLTENQINYVCSTIKEFYGRK